MSARALVARAIARTRVARRIVLLFVVCAVVPIVSLALVSYASISTQLRERAGERLYRGSKASGLALMQRLQSLEGELQLEARGHIVDGRAAPVRLPQSPHFTRIAIVPVESAASPGDSVPSFSRTQLDHMDLDKAVLAAEPGPSGVPLLWMAVRVGRWIAVGDVSAEWLWGPPIAAMPHPEPDLCVFRGSDEPLFCPPGIADRIRVGRSVGAGAGLTFEWAVGETRYVAASWPLFMRYYFDGPDWTIISSETTDYVFEPLRDFRKAYGLVMGAAFLLVALLSMVTIRRNMEPLARLHAATERIAERNFSEPVHITSNDEFENLADSFNVMAGSLRRQFDALGSMVDLGQSLLAARDRETVARIGLVHAVHVFGCRSAALFLLPEPGIRGMADVWVLDDGAITRESASRFLLRLPEHAPTNPSQLADSAPETKALPEALAAAPGQRWVAQIRVDGRRAGALVFVLDASGPQGGSALSGEAALMARQLTDHLAMALSGTQLVRELDELSWGALHALARAIDLKSSWTAGHSDRVTAYALALGRRIGLDAVQLEQLERGGLLHDIGKIGVSAEILDKPGKLTADEWEIMKSHTTLGGRILEPILRYADIQPIVLYHHEKFDGTGYPVGLRGEAIPLLARVLSVADVYDALTSERPYRPGMTRERALSIIEEDAGTHFDPRIAQGFLAMMRSEEADAVLENMPNPRENVMVALARA